MDISILCENVGEGARRLESVEIPPRCSPFVKRHTRCYFKRSVILRGAEAGALRVLACLALVACSVADGPRPAPAQTTFLVTHETEPDRQELVVPEQTLCGDGMVAIDGRFCIDKYEASLVEVLPSGEERPISPFGRVRRKRVRAVSVPGVFPQGYVSAVEAQRACKAAGKRLCRIDEWRKACRGPEGASFGYGDRREPGRCNDRGRSPVIRLFGFRYSSRTMNDPRLNQQEGTLAKTGSHAGCTNGYGVFDMVGNLHEWVADHRGTFVGGYYQDVASKGHGEGCSYVTTAHAARYHDYSTGFRCCRDLSRK